MSMKVSKLFAAMLFILLSGNTAIAQDTINWRPGYKLQWSDFQGKPENIPDVKAITVANLSGDLSYNTDSFSAQVSVYFEKNKSWTLSTNQNLLSHEQGHFDIAELFARKFRKAFSEYKFNPKTIEADYNRIYSKTTSDRTSMNKLYDKETNFSRNITRQLYWSNKIKTELKKLDAYKSR